jgi:polyferredoxin
VRLIKYIGIGFFFLGFILFNVLFFFGKYQLTRDNIEENIQDSTRQVLFLQSGSDLFEDKKFTLFNFVSELNLAFEQANEIQYSIYGITQDEVIELVGRSGSRFLLTSVDSLYIGVDAVSHFKRKAFHDYGGWLDGRKFQSKEELAKQLLATVENINRYEIINKVGFDRYKVKDLLFSITKDASNSPVKGNPILFLFITIGFCFIGGIIFIISQSIRPSEVNNGVFFNSLKIRKWPAFLIAVWLIAFYILLYFFPEYIVNWVSLVDPVSYLLNGNEAGRFFLYGFVYTICILVMGVRMILYYKHNNYQIIRSFSVMFFQTAFAFLIPEILIRLNKPYFDFKNIWPLDYSFFFDSRIDELINNGSLGIFMLGWGISLIIVAVPIMVYFFGKRWYCSWVCGCGGLAETLGDPFRQLSSKSLFSWKVERWMIHSVLVFSIVMTIAVLYTYWTGTSWFLFIDSYKLREIYGAFIGAGFAGVIGTGFYPIMGNRVWCRFGCPLAAYLGLIQRFKSRFRITTNGGQCISCGNCSTYCEMGIDVRWYAQRGQNIVRSSCVGCGICSAVCPRGVLNLELKSEKGRFGNAILTGNNPAKVTE